MPPMLPGVNRPPVPHEEPADAMDQAPEQTDPAPVDPELAAIDHPDYVHPDTVPMMKVITLRRSDVVGHRATQSVHVHPEEPEGYSTAPKPGPLVMHALAGGMVPPGHRLSVRGKVLAEDEDLYSQVSHGDIVDILPPAPKEFQEYPMEMRIKTKEGFDVKTAKNKAEEKALAEKGYR